MALFGQHLKHWRGVRRLSQLDLAQRVGMSPRHVSFLETGRSRPTSPTIRRLADGLDVPLRHRNALYVAAGLAGPYADRSLDDPVLAPFRRVIEMMLERHEPYPALVMDRAFDVVEANRAARRLFDLDQGSPIELLLDPVRGGELVENWDELAWMLLRRLRREMVHEPRLEPLARRAEQALAGRRPPAPGVDIVACPRLRIGGGVVRTISTIARFDSALDPAAEGLHIELMFPADDHADTFFRTLAETP